MWVYGFFTTISWGSMAQAAGVSRDTYMLREEKTCLSAYSPRRHPFRRNLPCDEPY